MSISTAISTDRRSRTSGYQIKKLFNDIVSGNLPQRIVILGEANTANQAGLVLNREITSAAQAGQLYGFGSPIYQIMRILRPVSGDGIGGIPTIVMPQVTAGGATATVIVYTITGTATANATHTLLINGRANLDGRPYSFNVVTGDTPTVIAGKMISAINAVLGSPFIATNVAGVVTLTTKWKGATSANTNISVNNSAGAAGVTYAVTSNTAGTGVVDISGALGQFANTWYTTVINAYDIATLDALEAFNGVPNDTTPTGRYDGRVFMPFMAFFGNTDNVSADLLAITNANARINQVTNVLCPAPGSLGMPWEAAANMVSLFCRMMQDNPHLDAGGLSYPDMPTPDVSVGIGDMSDYNNRDLLVKNGCSTVTLGNGAYTVQDLVTTYHPDGELPLQYAYCRNLNLDWNVKDGYITLEKIFVRDHVIVDDGQVTDVPNVIRPSDWKGDLFDYFDTLAKEALINAPDYSKASLNVGRPSNNPDRFETSFRYKRTGIARIESTDAYAGF